MLTATDEVKAKYLGDFLVKLYDDIIDFGFKHAALLTLVFGWILTSEDAKRYFDDHILIRIFGTLGVMLVSGFHVKWVFRYYDRSQKTFNLLKEIGYMPLEVYEVNLIKKYLPLSFSAMHIMLSSLICVAFWIPKKISPVLPCS